MTSCKINSPIYLILIIFFQICNGQTTNPNNYWHIVGTGPRGPIANGANVSCMDASGKVYIAGPVEEDGRDVIRVAVFNGRQSTILGQKLRSPLPNWASVLAITVANNGDVYVGGDFTEAVNADGSVVTVNNIVRWDATGNQWESLGLGIGGSVAAITVDANQNVYVGGNLYEGMNADNSTISLQYTGMWNHTQNQWQTVGSGVNGGVTSLDMVNGSLVCAGNFSEAYNPDQSSINAKGISVWNGTNWSALGLGLQPSQNSGGALSPEITHDGSGNIIVTGYIETATNSNSTTVAGPVVLWDGSQWTSLKNNLSLAYPISGMSVDKDGKIYMIHYTSELTSPSQVVSALNGSTWNTIAKATGINSFYTLASNPDFPQTSLFLGGSFNTFDNPLNSTQVNITNNAFWNGNAWDGLNLPVFSGEVNSLEVDNILNPAILYAGGSFSSVNGVLANNIALFEGDEWQSLGQGVNGPVYAIQPINVYPFSGVFVGGSFNQAGNPDSSTVNVSNLAFWDNNLQEWQNIGGLSGPVYALSMFGQVLLYVGGDFLSTNNGSSIEVNNIARFHLFSGTWESLGSGIGSATVPNPVVHTLALNAPDYGRGATFIHLYVGGRFSYAENADGSRVACRNMMLWDEVADTWNDLGYGTDDEILTMAIPKNQLGDLWVGGRFRTAVNRNGSYVADLPYAAIWNGFEWHKLAGGVNGPVHNIEFANGNNQQRVFLGGEFNEAENPDGTIEPTNHIGIYERNNAYGPDGGMWETLAFGTDSTVNSIVSVWPCSDTNKEIAYAGGSFSKAGYWKVDGLAKWKAPHTANYPVYSGTIVNSSRNNNGQNSRRRGVVTIRAGLACSGKLSKSTLDEFVLFDSLASGESVLLPDLPQLMPFSLTLYDVDNPAQPIAVYDSLTITSALPQLFVLLGVDDTTFFAPNPEGLTISESLIKKDLIVSAKSGDIPAVFVHTVTDAPMLDIISADGDTLISALKYGRTSTSIGLQPGIYTVDLVRSSDGQKISTQSFTISNQNDQYNIIALNGFLDPSANQNGPAMSIEVYDTPVAPVTTTRDRQSETYMPGRFNLFQNYPNPFNPQTTITYILPAANGPDPNIQLTVYDVLGRKVKTLVNEKQKPGVYNISFDATDLSSGVYYYRLTDGNFTKSRKMILIH